MRKKEEMDECRQIQDQIVHEEDSERGQKHGELSYLMTKDFKDLRNFKWQEVANEAFT